MKMKTYGFEDFFAEARAKGMTPERLLADWKRLRPQDFAIQAEQQEPVAEQKVPEDSIDRLMVGKGTEGDQILAAHTLQQAEIFEDLYWEFIEQIEPFVRRMYKAGGEDMPLPASLHGTFNIFFDHWLKDQECFCLDSPEGHTFCDFCRVKAERGIPLRPIPAALSEPVAVISIGITGDGRRVSVLKSETGWLPPGEYDLYTQPQRPAVPPHCEVVDKIELMHLRDKMGVILQCQRGELWYWQGDGGDVPETIGCPVVMSADTLRQLVAAKSATPAAQEGRPYAEIYVGDGKFAIFDDAIFKLVPIEPTQDMVNTGHWPCAHNKEIWKNMIIAAPQQDQHHEQQEQKL